MPETLRAYVGEETDYTFDFASLPEIRAGGVLTGTPVVTASPATGLTLGSPTIVASPKTGVAGGGVQLLITVNVAGNYQMSCTSAVNGGPVTKIARGVLNVT